MWSGVEYLLEVVEHQQHLPRAQETDEPLRQRSTAHVMQAERLGNGGDDQSGIADRSKVGEDRPVREARCDPLSDCKGEASLARPTWARQREEPNCGLIEERTNSSNLCLSPDEWCEGQRERSNIRERLGVRLRVAVRACRGKERLTVCRAEVEGIGQHADRSQVRRAPHPPFQVADAA